VEHGFTVFTQPKSGFLGLNNDRFTMVFPDSFPERRTVRK
jgi:hypothetical protein